jgi:hypothetical protein
MYINIKETGAWDYNNNSHDESHYLDKPLADWIVNFIKLNNIKTLFDFGCSSGYYLKYISDNTESMNLIGVEPNILERKDNHFENIVSHDLAMPFSLGQKGSLICLEVLEHIPAEFESNAIDNVENHCDDYLFMSWAVPGQGGHGHFNEKSFEDVVALFNSRGFEFMPEETREARSLATLPWLRNNFSLFRKKISH